LGDQADLTIDRVEVDGKLATLIPQKVYYLFHKPQNVMVTRRDPQRRPIIFDYLAEIKERVNPVGRLDFDSEGLLLLTNDGELLAKLTHPRHEVPKIYHVKISGFLSEDILKKLREGVLLDDEKTQPCEVRVFKKNPYNCWVEMVLREGKNRQIRRMMETLGIVVLRLVRVGLGSLQLGELKKGAWRPLTRKETEQLQKTGTGV